MADFTISMKVTRPWEGGYVNDPDDAGGETYGGITRRDNPTWPGWAIVDAAKPLRNGAYVQAAEPYVAPHYQRHYWPVVKGDQIKDQRVAGFLFDWYVNSGTRAVRAVQLATGQHADGILGPKTLAAINAHDAAKLFDELKAMRTAFVQAIVANRPSQKKFLTGWLRRVNSFK
jgi:lysozyme family protein